MKVIPPPDGSVGGRKGVTDCPGGPIVYMIKKHRVRKMAEIGVFQGEMTRRVLSSVPAIEEYWCVDPWENCDGRGQEWWDEIFTNFFRCTRQLKLEERDKIRMLRMRSVEAAKEFVDGSLDFVYVDALHDYQHVAEDIRAWLPKIKSGGIMGGHDYTRRHKGVVRAVDETFGEDIILMKNSCWFVPIEEGKK